MMAVVAVKTRAWARLVLDSYPLAQRKDASNHGLLGADCQNKDEGRLARAALCKSV